MAQEYTFAANAAGATADATAGATEEREYEDMYTAGGWCVIKGRLKPDLNDKPRQVLCGVRHKPVPYCSMAITAEAAFDTAATECNSIGVEYMRNERIACVNDNEVERAGTSPCAGSVGAGAGVGTSEESQGKACTTLIRIVARGTCAATSTHVSAIASVCGSVTDNVIGGGSATATAGGCYARGHTLDDSSPASNSARSVFPTTIVELVPVTGRTHQLRVHCASVLGHALLGDTLYATSNIAKTLPRLALHAYKLSFLHPVKANRIEVLAPLDMEDTQGIKEHAQVVEPGQGDIEGTGQKDRAWRKSDVKSGIFGSFARDLGVDNAAVWPLPREEHKKRRLR